MGFVISISFATLRAGSGRDLTLRGGRFLLTPFVEMTDKESFNASDVMLMMRVL